MPDGHAHGLQLAERQLTTARVAEDHVGQPEPEHGDPADGVERPHRLANGQRSAGPRVEEVDGDFGRRQLGQLTDQLEALGDRLAHAEEDAAAQLHARPLVRNRTS